MLNARERAQLIAAARLYYEDDLTQAEVAKRLGVSRPIVSKMLARAREVGIVHIEIRGGDEQDSDILEHLQRKYNLNGVLIVSSGKGAAEQAARYLALETAADKNLGLGWGYLAGDIVEKMGVTKLHTQDGFIFPLIGHAHYNLHGYHPDNLVRRWGETMGRTSYYLKCPAFPDSEEKRDELEASADRPYGVRWIRLLFLSGTFLTCLTRVLLRVLVMHCRSKRLLAASCPITTMIEANLLVVIVTFAYIFLWHPCVVAEKSLALA